MNTGDRFSWPLPASELEPALALLLALESAPMGVIMLRQGQSDSLYPVLGRGLSGDQVDRFGIHRIDVGPFGTASGSRRRVSIADVWETELSAVGHELGFRAMDIVPLYRGEGPALGVAAALFQAPATRQMPNYPNVDLCAGMLVCMLENAQLRQAAELAKSRAEQIARDKVEFLARLSHELRNPLSAITGYLELLRLDLGELTEPQSTLLDRVRRSERMLMNIIEDVITFAKLEVGHTEYHITVAPVTAIIEAADLVTRPMAESRGLALHVDIRQRRLAVIADPTRVRQILTNLLTNSVKFTAQGGTITLTCAAAGPNTVEFIVEDTGIGIPENALDAIFRPYVQVSPQLVDGVGGSGLGLAISRDFAEAMHGRLTVRSEVGKGSTFTLQLPRGPDGGGRAGRRTTPFDRGVNSRSDQGAPVLVKDPSAS
jgi:signal transduction histidine kinase